MMTKNGNRRHAELKKLAMAQCREYWHRWSTDKHARGQSPQKRSTVQHTLTRQLSTLLLQLDMLASNMPSNTCDYTPAVNHRVMHSCIRTRPCQRWTTLKICGKSEYQNTVHVEL